MSPIYSIAFYNLENLFDPMDNEVTLDKDYTPEGIFKWDKDKYEQKIEKLSKVMSKIGTMRSEVPPLLIGVCEVENETCLNDLIHSKHLKDHGYGYVFHRSPDTRGIHVGLLYRKDCFEVSGMQGHSLELNKEGDPEFSRDILCVKGWLFGREIHVLLNHWPSRTDGTMKTNYKRKSASRLIRDIISDITAGSPGASLLVMGDFNEDPMGKYIRQLGTLDLINPMEQFQVQKKGSVKYKGKWMMFDQIMFNKNLRDSEWWHFLEAHIFVEPYLVQKSGRYKGSPKRTYIGKYHQGGYSDHFPVFIYFEKSD